MAIRINRVYTRTGDDGSTGLVGGRRVDKNDPRVAAYGDVDELNSAIGMVRAILAEPPYRRQVAARTLNEILSCVQQELFDLGSELATLPEDAYEGMGRIGTADIARLEQRIDDLQRDLEPLESFVLPGGGPAGAGLHMARCVCRRAERAAVGLLHRGSANGEVVRYLNRLSDLLFVAARWISAKTGHAETLWQRGRDAKRTPRGQPKR